MRRGGRHIDSFAGTGVAMMTWLVAATLLCNARTRDRREALGK